MTRTGCVPSCTMFLHEVELRNSFSIPSGDPALDSAAVVPAEEGEAEAEVVLHFFIANPLLTVTEVRTTSFSFPNYNQCFFPIGVLGVRRPQPDRRRGRDDRDAVGHLGPGRLRLLRGRGGEDVCRLQGEEEGEEREALNQMRVLFHTYRCLEYYSVFSECFFFEAPNGNAV